jgi:hypothetical protein
MVRRGLLVILLGLVLSSCSTQPVMVESVEQLPAKTATDWVTYGDHLVKVRIDSEQRVPPTAVEVEAGEGLIGRRVSLTIEETLWSRANAPAAAPKTLQWDAGGWHFKGGTERPLQYSGVPRLEPGHTYLVLINYGPMSLDGTGPSVGMPLSGLAMLPFDDNTIGKGEKIPLDDGSTYAGTSRKGATAMRDTLWGTTAQTAVATLRQTAPYPVAAQHMSKNPVQRYRAVLEATTPKQTPGPGEY